MILQADHKQHNHPGVPLPLLKGIKQKQLFAAEKSKSTNPNLPSDSC
jgi:hypothetical protein